MVIRRNQIRIIGGTHKSRIIKFKQNNILRPTANIVRERLFNWLGQDLTDKIILDLFGGSGVLGFESASRGANKVFIIENNFSTYKNLEKLKLELSIGNIFIYVSDALNFLKSDNNYYDIIFLDPPYSWDRWEELLGLLKGHVKLGTIIYIESNRFIEYDDLDIIKFGKSGISKYFLCRYKF